MTPTAMLPIAITVLLVALPTPHVSPQGDEESSSEPEWKGTFGAGLSFSSGNTDRRSAHALVDAALRDGDRRYTLDFHWQYADEAEGGPRELLERHAGASGQVDFFLDEKAYFLVNANAETDYQAELDLRYSAGIGYGYQVFDEDDWKLSIEAGTSSIHEQFANEEDDSYLSGRIGYSIERGLGGRWTLSQDSEVFPSFEEAEDVHAEVDTRLRCELSKNLYGQFQWIFDWDNTPAEGAEREDHRLLFSVGYSF